MTDEIIAALRGLEEGRTGPPRARAALEQRAVAELVPLLGSTERNDAARLAVLDAVVERANRADIAALARVTRRQRPRVASPTVELLARLGGPEAAFALGRSLSSRRRRGRRSACGGRAGRGSRRGLRRRAEGKRELWPALETRELGFSVLLADAPQLEPMRGAEKGDPAAVAVAQALEQLDGEARDALQANSQSEHDIVVRNTVYDTLLVSGAPVHPAMRERAEELLMRRPAADIEPVLLAVDDDVRLRYVDRVLRPEHRETRVDRVVLALGALRAGEPDARAERRRVIENCLTASAGEIRVVAALTLLEAGLTHPPFAEFLPRPTTSPRRTGDRSTWRCLQASRSTGSCPATACSNGPRQVRRMRRSAVPQC